ncbi:MAG TPA: hypothetical protein VIV11_02135 [Kofleriaceae bacterium]
MRLVALALLAACGAAAKPSPSSTRGPPYLVLFESGRTWTLPITTVTGERRGDAWVATSTQSGTLACEVAGVKPVGDATVSRVSCAAPYAGLLVVGGWVATPAGLYHPALPIDDVDELALLGDEELLITARARDREHSQATGGMQHSIQAFPHERSWCVRDTTSVADERRVYTLCFSEAGVTGGGELVITGADRRWHRTTFGSVAEDADDPTLGHSD